MEQHHAKLHSKTFFDSLCKAHVTYYPHRARAGNRAKRGKGKGRRKGKGKGKTRKISSNAYTNANGINAAKRGGSASESAKPCFAHDIGSRIDLQKLPPIRDQSKPSSMIQYGMEYVDASCRKF